MAAAVVALIALTAMEIVLGIDNIVFIAILTGRLPLEQQAKARQIGLLLALGTRILLLCTLNWILGLTEPVTKLAFLEPWLITAGIDDSHAREHILNISVRDIILIVGGLFLIWKSVHEIHDKIEGHEEARQAKVVSYGGVLAQIALLDIIFSLDSVITAVGMVNKNDSKALALGVMITAVILAVIVMLIFAGAVSRFVERYPTVKMLALSFLILIGVMLLAEGIGTEISKGYIYFAMTFALAVEVLNIRMKAASERTACEPSSSG